MHVIFWTNGIVVTLHNGGQYDELSGPWTEVMPKILRKINEGECFSLNMGRADNKDTWKISESDLKHLWLSVCRDEDLIIKCTELVKAYRKSNNFQSVTIDNAIIGLRNALLMRGCEL